MQNLCIIEAPSNLGLKEPVRGKEPGVRKLPEWLKIHELYKKLQADKINTVTAPAYSMYLDKISGVRNADAIALYSRQLSTEIQNAIRDGFFPLVIGGDCSVLIGCAHALKSGGKYGLFFIDGHTDFVMPHTSLTKGAAGMDLAIVTGHGHDKLTNLDNLKPYLDEQHTLAFGNRYLEKKYVQTIRNSAISYYDLNAVRKTGIKKIAKRFLEKMHDEEVKGFWIHLDVDVLDDKLMPCVDSRQPDGLSYKELRLILHSLLTSGLATGMDITILDPDLDSTGMYAIQFVNELTSTFQKA